MSLRKREAQSAPNRKARRRRAPGTRPASRRSKATVEVAAGLVFRRGALLITRRPRGSHLGGLWEFPGGKRKPGETFEHCLVRELGEELGIEVEVERVLERVTHNYPGKKVRLVFFQCRWRRNEPRALGCPAFKWISCNELKDYEFPAADAQLVRRLENTPEWWRRGGVRPRRSGPLK